MTSVRSPYADMQEVAEITRKDRTKHPLLNAWRFVQRHRLTKFRDGHRVLVLRSAVHDALKGRT